MKQKKVAINYFLPFLTQVHPCLPVHLKLFALGMASAAQSPTTKLPRGFVLATLGGTFQRTALRVRLAISFPYRYRVNSSKNPCAVHVVN